MTPGRFSFLCMTAILLNCLVIGTACAGLFGSDDTGKSGLDFTGGYDINTVSTMSGRAVSLPHAGEKDAVIVEIKGSYETLHIYVGPGSFWKTKGIAVNLNDELTVKGSKALGKDGKSYVLAQKLVNRATGAQVELRSEKGDPVWSGRGTNSMRSENPGGAMRSLGGGMMRSGGGMMRH